MSRNVLILLLTLGLAPVAVLAQDQQAPPPPPATAAPAQPATPAQPGPSANPGGPMRPQFTPAERQAMMQPLRRFLTETRRIRRAERERMLESLTAAHRALLARVAGNLAVSVTPNRRAAIRELDASLYASEKSSIIAAQRSAMTQMRAAGRQMLAQMRAQMQSMMPMPQPSSGPHNQMWVHRNAGMMRHHHAPSAGAILLRTVTGGGGGPQVFFMMRGDHGGPPPPPQQP